jgi:hypothetical protein
MALNNYSLDDIIYLAKKNTWAIEFSSGIEYFDKIEQFYLTSDIKRMPHNYFPAPKVPFVLNLASKSKSIRKKSIKHCINGLRLARQTQAPFFAAHAGFCIDPIHTELGKKINYNNNFNRENHLNIFLESIFEILKYSKSYDITFLIENNVITKFNLNNSINPFLCCESSEIEFVCRAVNQDLFGILLDTAHLKVSANTLRKNINDEFQIVQKYIKGIHHSDNNGLVDNNSKITNDYWFLPYLKNIKNIPQVLEVKSLSENEIIEQLKFLN